MKKKSGIFFLPLFFFIFSGVAHSQAVISKRELISNVLIYPDLKKKSIFYYPPGDLEIALDNFGKPEIKFVQMRYTGTQATDDQGKINYRSILQFTVRMKHQEGNQLREIRNTLESRNRGAAVQLLPLPVKKMESMLIYALAEENGKPADKPQKVSGGNLESASTEDEGGDIGEYWNERTYTISLDKYSSQIFWSTLEKGQLAMSLAFSYFVDGVNPTTPEYHISTTGVLNEAIQDEWRQMATDSLADTTGKAVLLKADAFGIILDTKKFPDLIKKVDINAAFTPPDFAVLDVRCYDFNNELRPDLYAKRIEVEAVGMNGEPVKDRRTFYSSAPDIYYAGIRFKYAVRMDKPFRYRIIEIKNDIAPVYGNWITAKNWNKIIDITTKK